MPNSTTPPPKKSGNTGFIAAAIVMLLMMGGLIFWKMGQGSDTETSTTTPTPTKPTAAPVLDEPPPPPPPPPTKEEVPDAGTKTTKKAVGTGSGGCSGECTGTAPAALQSALAAKAGQARGCYERALRQNAMLEGRLSIAVRIGPLGQVCSANVASNSLGDAAVATCVQQMFRAGKFPPPKGGCVEAQVPMNFVAKK